MCEGTADSPTPGSRGDGQRDNGGCAGHPEPAWCQPGAAGRVLGVPVLLREPGWSSATQCPAPRPESRFQPSRRMA